MSFKIKILSIYFLCVQLIAALGFAEDIDINKANERISQSIFNTLKACHIKIWPNLKINNLHIVLLNSKQNEQLVISFKEDRIYNIPKSRIPDFVFNGLYSFFKIDDQPWMSINTEEYASYDKKATLESVVDGTFKVAIHEAFHNQGQKGWNKSGTESRGTLVPIAWEPRFYRSMIYKNLVTVLRSRYFNHTALNKAKYWYDLWVKNYPLEVKMTTDGYEGSAFFVELLTFAYSKFGCEDINPQVNKFIAQNITGGLDIFLNGSRFALDSEGYLLGSVASFILRQQKVIPNWEERLAQGETPLAQLMSLVKPKFQPVYENKIKPFKETQVKEQAEVDELLLETYDNLKDSSSLIVRMPANWAPPVFSPLGFFYDPSLNIDFAPLATDFKFLDADSETDLTSFPKAAYFGSLDNPCDESANVGNWTFAIKSDEFSSIGENKIKIKNKLFEGVTSGIIVRDSKGHQWFCAGQFSAN